jgi:hypothetical protein
MVWANGYGRQKLLSHFPNPTPGGDHLGISGLMASPIDGLAMIVKD